MSSASWGATTVSRGWRIIARVFRRLMAGAVACRRTRQCAADLEADILFGDHLMNEVVSPPRPEHSVRGGEWRRTDLLATGSEMLLLAVQASDTGRPGYRLRRGVTTVLGIVRPTGCSLSCSHTRQRNAYRGRSRLPHGLGCLFGAWWLHRDERIRRLGPADALYEKFGITVLRSWRRQSVCSHIGAASWRAAIDCWPQRAPYGSSRTVSRA